MSIGYTFKQCVYTLKQWVIYIQWVNGLIIHLREKLSTDSIPYFILHKVIDVNKLMYSGNLLAAVVPILYRCLEECQMSSFCWHCVTTESTWSILLLTYQRALNIIINIRDWILCIIFTLDDFTQPQSWTPYVHIEWPRDIRTICKSSLVVLYWENSQSTSMQNIAQCGQYSKYLIISFRKWRTKLHEMTCKRRPFLSEWLVWCYFAHVTEENAT